MQLEIRYELPSGYCHSGADSIALAKMAAGTCFLPRLQYHFGH
jgi:hypothetical protein